MLNNKLIVEKNSIKSQKVRIMHDKNGNKIFVYKHNKSFFDINDFSKLLAFFECVSKSVLKNFPIIIDLKKCIFADKLTYIMLECICHYYLNDKGCKGIFIKLNNETEIITNGLELSPLNLLVNTDDINKRNDLYNKKFEKDYSNRHYRKIIHKDDDSCDNPVASILMQNVESYLKIQDVSNSYIGNISEVISELVDNVIEHSDSDCLVDIDITPSTFKKLDPVTKEYSQESYYGLNVVVVNLSDILIGELLEQKMKLYTDENIPERYKTVKSAKQKISKVFNNEYDEKDFFVVASFQDKISGRINSSKTGGTGLTELLKSLQDNVDTDTYNCYMYSGNRVLWFKREFLNYNEDGWIGFNEKNDFFEEKPDKEAFGKIPFYFPGTAYNLNFIVRKDLQE